MAGYPVVGLKVTLEDGSYHEVDSSDMAFQTCARTCMRENFVKTRPVLLEPVMKIEIECPGQFQGPVVGNLTSRRGMVMATEMDGPNCPHRRAKCRLAETFGYSTDLRSMTQGQGTFTHGIRPLSPLAAEHRARSDRRAEAGGPGRGVNPSEGLPRRSPHPENAGTMGAVCRRSLAPLPVLVAVR